VFGFASVVHVAGGVPEWQKQGLPLTGGAVAAAAAGRAAPGS
jgi:hypothetical protein